MTLHSKLEGLAAYETLEQGGQTDDPIWRCSRQEDEQAARRLMRKLEQFCQQGKPRAR